MDEEEREEGPDREAGIKEIARVYLWVWRHLLGQETHRHVRRMLGLMVAATVVSMATPWLFGLLIDALQRRNAIHVLIMLGLTCLIMLLREFLLRHQSRARELALGSSIGEIDDTCNRLFMEKSLGQHLRDQDRLSAANTEKGRARTYEVIHLLAFDGVETTVLILFSYACLWVKSPVSALIVTFVFATFSVWSVFLNRRVAHVCVPLDARFRALNRYRFERWKSVERVKSFGKEDEEVALMSRRFDNLLKDDRRFWLWYIDQASFRNAANVVCLSGILGYAAWRVFSGAWTLGLLYPIFIWARLVTDNLWRLGQIEQRLSWNMPSIRSMMQALTTPSDVVEKPDAIPLAVNGCGVRVEFSGLSHSFDDRRRGGYHSVLRDVSFTIEPGERVALLGRSGAGKSTIVRLLQRGMDPQSGAIRINGHDLRDVSLKTWLNLVGYIPQQPSVLDGTIRYNLVYGFDDALRDAVPDEALWQIARDLQIDFGARLTHGLLTRVGENGIRLSGGEAQRLTIGTAAAKRPLFMLIDEATSSLDSTTERDVQEGLAKVLEKGVSALIITHRLSTVRNLCTKFIVLRRVDELKEGDSQVEAVAYSFRELADISPTFRTLAEHQRITI